MEIERKFLIEALPDNIADYKYHDIEQAYLCGEPTIRIRKKDDKYIFTYKSKFGLEHLPASERARINQEIEAPLTKEGYEHLLEKHDGNIISKRRYLIPLEDGHTVELDEFKGVLSGLLMAEVEFESLEDAEKFVVPDWFGQEVTEDKRYRNKYLCTVDKYWI